MKDTHWVRYVYAKEYYIQCLRFYTAIIILQKQLHMTADARSVC